MGKCSLSVEKVLCVCVFFFFFFVYKSSCFLTGVNRVCYITKLIRDDNSSNPYLWLSFSKRSDREVRGASQVLQLVWAHKELRRPLEKDGWKKTDFMVNINPGTTTTNGPSTRANGTYEDSTTPLLDRGEQRKYLH